ncbi:cytochrome P450 [Xylaria sp. CBS 124048]|nr:cytochrome P450 [Xylaria sp. CBS 124048]
MPVFPHVVIGIPVIIVLVLWRLSQIGRRPRDYPPGPPTLPLIGNLHQIASTNRHLQFQKWAQEYGPIYSLMLGAQVVIVLSSDVVIKELVDKRSSIYSSRPEAYIAQDVISGGLRPLFMRNDSSQSGHIWRVARKLMYTVLNPTSAQNYIPYQDLESKAMLLGLLERPDDFVDHIRRYSTSLTTQMTFAHRTIDIDDGTFKEAFDIFDRSSALIASKTSLLLDLVPVLRHIPAFLVPVKKEAQEIYQQELRLFQNLYFDVRRRVNEKTCQPCVAADLVRLQETESFSDALAAYIGGSIFQAGSETTAIILIGFVQAMTLFPDVVKAAQAQLDSVCGDRLPGLDDAPDLPYINACCKESLRWMPGFLLCVPHAVSQDDVYMDYHIPKGATVILNTWAINHDPKRHPKPEEFNPMRYINDHQSSSESSNNSDATKRDHFTFGAGRRKCSGMHIADRSLFLAICRMLWAFDFKKAVDPVTLQEITPDMTDLTDGFVSTPKPFKTSIVPRNPARLQSIKAEWAEMMKLLDKDTLEWKILPQSVLNQTYGDRPRG